MRAAAGVFGSRISLTHNPRVDEIDRLHAKALAEGKDTYIDPKTGYEVFTTTYLLRYGSCCESGCRHCPYGFSSPSSSDPPREEPSS